MKLKPVGKYVFVSFIEESSERKTPGGLVLPDQSKPPLRFAKILKIGNEVTKVCEQDKIWFGAGSFICVTVGDSTGLVHEDNILAVIDE
jgi:co-chaperonin GroES (HSP10)